jgi:ABC-2 type transport system permease protein
MNALPILVRREFWEHRALWIAPLVVAAILLAIVVSGRGIVHLPDDLTASALNENQKLAIFALTHWGMTVPQYLVMTIVLFFYLLDALYAERRERSILFWKSLPVSDAATVISKLLVAIVVVPFGVYLLAFVSDILFQGLFLVRQGDSLMGAALREWDTGLWLRIHALMLGCLAVAVLWYAPIAAYLLLISAWARRNVFLWALLPPILLLIVEEIAFNTDYVKSFIAYRLFGIWTHLGGANGLDQVEATLEDDSTGSVRTIIESLDVTPAFASPDLWIGIAAAAALAWGAVRIRRYRDDT